jgi:esterase/lipase superfamily enzyme
MKLRERWYSPRVQSDVTVVRWGHYGRPVIVFPTARGDAEEIERMRVIDSLGDLIDAGRIKVYSCDSTAGYAMVRGDGSPRYRAALLDGFHHFVRDEMIPAIWADCSTPGAMSSQLERRSGRSTRLQSFFGRTSATPGGWPA